MQQPSHEDIYLKAARRNIAKKDIWKEYRIGLFAMNKGEWYSRPWREKRVVASVLLGAGKDIHEMFATAHLFGANPKDHERWVLEGFRDLAREAGGRAKDVTGCRGEVESNGNFTYEVRMPAALLKKIQAHLQLKPAAPQKG